ncbi:MAG: hypothetical protein ABIJ34_09215 [archaeon]
MPVNLTRRGPQQLRERFRVGGPDFELAKWNVLFSPGIEQIIPLVGEKLAEGYQICLNEFERDPFPEFSIRDYTNEFPYVITSGSARFGFDRPDIVFYAVSLVNQIEMGMHMQHIFSKTGANYGVSALDFATLVGFEEIYHLLQPRKPKPEPSKEEVAERVREFLSAQPTTRYHPINEQRKNLQYCENEFEEDATNVFERIAPKYGIEIHNHSQPQEIKHYSTIQRFKSGGDLGFTNSTRTNKTGNSIPEEDNLVLGAIIDLASRLFGIAYLIPGISLYRDSKPDIHYDEATKAAHISSGYVFEWYNTRRRIKNVLSAEKLRGTEGPDFALFNNLTQEMFKHHQLDALLPHGHYENRNDYSMKLDREISFASDMRRLWSHVIHNKSSPWLR